MSSRFAWIAALICFINRECHAGIQVGEYKVTALLESAALKIPEKV